MSGVLVLVTSDLACESLDKFISRRQGIKGITMEVRRERGLKPGRSKD